MRLQKRFNFTPCLGDRKIIKRFLFLPVKINDEIRWWETAILEYEYCSVETIGDELGPYYSFQWVLKRFKNE